MRETTSIAGGTKQPPRLASGRPSCLPVLALSVPGWPVSFHPELDSTNLEAKRRIALGETGKGLVLAESQKNGQCRHDRLWESPSGKGIWASFILPVAVPCAVLPQSTLVLAVAVREGIERATNVPLEIKWPNDLLGKGRKCCGLLVETDSEFGPGTATPLILGVGINCDHEAGDFPPYLRDTATSLSLLANGERFHRETVLSSVARSVEHWFAIWETEGFSPVRTAWLRRNCTLGRQIILPEGYGHARATARDLDESGALVAVTDDGGTVRVDSGEILFQYTGEKSPRLFADGEKRM